MNRLAESEGAAMTFAEIAKAMGYRDPEGSGKNAVWMLYRSAIMKLRRNPVVLSHLRSLATEIARIRAERERSEVAL